ncbi:hypothetical protein BKA69DRAFT_1091698 [Paraphysoderma sedebokerense]|nr:hypothetical protein BKA69DRAFT_1091698 [Paraphysoderma sedebokerense]
MPYIIALVNCTLGIPEKLSNDIETKLSIDIVLFKCTIKLLLIPTYGGMIFQSSVLQSQLYSGFNSKVIFLGSRTESSLDFSIDNSVKKLIVQSDTKNSLKGTIHVNGEGRIDECDLGDNQLKLDLDSNFDVIRQCGLKNNWNVLRETIESNIDIIVLLVLSLSALFISIFDPKQRAGPVASLSISFLSTYSAISRIIISFSTKYDSMNFAVIGYAVMFVPILVTVCHSIYMTPKLCSRYRLPNKLVTWLLIALGPSNLEILWSNFLGLNIFSHTAPKMKPQILGLLEINRSIAQDIAVSFFAELLNSNVTIWKIVRNCITVLSLLYTLQRWKAGRVYVKLGCLLLAIPVLTNIALLFAPGDLYATAYTIYMLCLSIFTSTLIGMTKYTSDEYKYGGILCFILGPILVLAFLAVLLTGGSNETFLEMIRNGAVMLSMGVMSFLCLLTNIWHYRKVWNQHEEE